VGIDQVACAPVKSRRWANALVLTCALLTFLPDRLASATEPEVSEVCRFTDERLTEISGLARSLRHPGTLWAVNDSSGGPYVYAIDERTCAVQARIELRGAAARDPEAIATGVDERGRPTIWVGDIGDNRDSWPTITLLALREPKRLADRAVAVRSWAFTYPDRPHDAETLLADPASARLWIATKQLASGALVALDSVIAGGDRALEVDRVGGLVTDGAVAPDGSRYVIRDYFDARIFEGLPPGREVMRIPLPAQPQGEAITWTADGEALLIASEGDDRLLRVQLPIAQQAAGSQESATALPTPPTGSATEAAGSMPLPTPLVIGAGVAVISLLLLLAEWARRRGGSAE